MPTGISYTSCFINKNHFEFWEKNSLKSNANSILNHSHHNKVFGMHRFDILVNGGGSVTLEFTRQPFQSHTISVSVPWNQIITIEPVIMDLHSIDFSEPDPSLCAVGHDHHTMKPIVLSTWQHTQLGACPEKSTLIPESQVCCTSGPQSMHPAL